MGCLGLDLGLLLEGKCPPFKNKKVKSGERGPLFTAGGDFDCIILENNMVIPKNKNKMEFSFHLYRPAFLLLGIYYLKCLRAQRRIDICSPVFIVLITKAKIWKQIRYARTDDCTYTSQIYPPWRMYVIHTWFIDTMKWYLYVVYIYNFFLPSRKKR